MTQQAKALKNVRPARWITGAVWCLILSAFPGLLPADQGDVKRGALAFRACIACHTVEPGRHLTGPSLGGLFGRKAGSAPGFMRYSDALQKSGVVWDERTLDAWLTNPAHLVPNNDMAFPGVKDPQARQDLIAYLATANNRKETQNERAAAPRMPRLKSAQPEDIVKSIHHCGDTYYVATMAGKTHKIWEFNLRFKTDTSEYGPAPGKPVIVGAGMRGDRATVVFAQPKEIGSFIEQRCD